MALNSARLDRFLSGYLQIPRKLIRPMLLQGRVLIDGKIEKNMDRLINTFNSIVVDGDVIQHCAAKYIMLNKPIGVVSATKDKLHKTVLDLLPQSEQDLHIVGRLDLNTSGLVLLTNDSRWSQSLMQPDKHVEKEYIVTVKNPLSNEYITAFKEGMYFPFENITTLPAKLKIISSHQARVSLQEGKYHQIKRMFGRFRNPVLAIHRYRIGNLCLDSSLAVGNWRMLNKDETCLATESLPIITEKI